MLLLVSEPGAVATDHKGNLVETLDRFFRRLKPAPNSRQNVIPGLRSLTRGYYLSSLRDSLTLTSQLSLCLRRSLFCSRRTQQIVGPERG